MSHLYLTPTITVTIAGQIRIYHAFVTTASPAVDAPSTLTLYTSTLADVAGFAADPLVFEAMRGRLPARLVLIETRELAWQREKYRADHAICAPADPVLVSVKTLQQWLWARLQAPLPTEVHA
jgi:hypothetical protein